MKITKSQLKQIIKEELNEAWSVEDWERDHPEDAGMGRMAAYKDYEPIYHDNVEVDEAAFAENFGRVVGHYRPEQIVESIAKSLKGWPPGEEALIMLAGVFKDLAKSAQRHPDEEHFRY